MDPINNNKFEVKFNAKSKRKIATPCPNVYLNPALDLLANEDPMCNTAMEIIPNKKRKRTRSCDIAAFENTALDLGISKAAVNEFLVRELENVKKNLKTCNSLECNNLNVDVRPNFDNVVVEMEPNIDIEPKIPNINIEPNMITEPIYANLTDISETVFPETIVTDENTKFENSMNDMSILPVGDTNSETSLNQDCMEISNIEPINVVSDEIDSGISVLEQKSINTITNSQFGNVMDLSAINTTNIHTNITNQVFINNPSNLSLSFIDRLALDSPNTSNQSLYLDDDLNESNIMEIKTITIITKKKLVKDKKRNTNPFLDPNLTDQLNNEKENPFLNPNETKPELEYNDEALNRPTAVKIPQTIIPRKLFSGENSTISTVNESSINNEQNEYENIDDYRSESPIYENVCEEPFNKQSKILGHDVSHFSAVDIMNLNKLSQGNSSNESDSKKDFKYQLLKASNKLSKKVLKTLKKTFKTEKPEHNSTLNPYEVPRKPPKQKTAPNESGIENPALNLDNSDEIEIEEIDDEEHQYETIKTLRNTRLNMNVTPLRERVNDTDISHNKTNTPGKKVRFDSTLNQEKIITGNSFDYDIQSPGFDSKIDKYHDELENCINERKFLQQNM